MLDTNNTNQAYLMGRLTAEIENVMEITAAQKTKAATESKGMLPYLLITAMRQANQEQVAKLADIADKIKDIKNLNPVEQSTFWIGYYHQKAAQ